MDPRKRKWLIIPAILFGVFILFVLFIILVMFRYQRVYRYLGLTISLVIIAFLFLFSALIASIVAVYKCKKNSLAFVELVVIALSIIPVSYFSFVVGFSFSFGYNGYQHFQKYYGDPQKFLRLGKGEFYSIYNDSYDYYEASEIRDNDNKVFDLIYNAPYKKVEKIHKKSEQLRYVKYGSQTSPYIKVFENGDAYIFDQRELFYQGGTQYLIFEKEIAQQIINTADQIISEYIS